MKKLLHNIRSSFKTKAFRTMPINFPSLGKVWMIGLLFSLLFFYSNGVKSQNCSVNAGVDATLCESDPMPLYGNATGIFDGDSAAVVLWQQIDGPTATIVSPNSLNTSVVNFVGGYVYTFRLSTTCEDGSLVYQDVNRTVNGVTVPDAGPDATYCGGDAASLSANTPTGPNEVGYWQGGGNGISIDDPNSPTSSLTISPTAGGTSNLLWTIQNTVSGCSSSDVVSITNRGGVTPVIVGDTIKPSHCYSTTTSAGLNGSYGGNGTDGQQGTWSVISGPSLPSISNVHSNTSGISNLIEGTYKLVWNVSGPCATGTDTAIIVVPPATADVTQAGISGGNVLRFCDGRTSVVLTANTPGFVNETMEWSYYGIDPSINIVTPNSPTTTVTGFTPTAGNSYSFSYTITNDTTECSSSASQSVSFYDPATMDVAASAILGCEESVAVIPYTATGGTNVTQVRVLSGPLTVIDNDTISFPGTWFNVSASPATIIGLTGTGVYKIQFRRMAPEGFGCSEASDQIFVITSHTPEESNAGTDQILDCQIDTTVIAGNVPLMGQGTWSVVSAPGPAYTEDNIHDPSLNVYDLTPGTYVFRWLITGGPNCEPNFDDMRVVVSDSIPEPVDAGSDQTICTGGLVHLNAEKPLYKFEIGFWTIEPETAGIVFSDTLNRKATLTGLTEADSPYKLYWNIKNGCGNAKDSLYITVSDDIAPVQADAGPDQCWPPEITQVTLAGNDADPFDGKWTVVSYPGSPPPSPHHL